MEKTENIIRSKDLKLGFAAEKIILELTEADIVSEAEALDLSKDCLKFVKYYYLYLQKRTVAKK